MNKIQEYKTKLEELNLLKASMQQDFDSYLLPLKTMLEDMGYKTDADKTYLPQYTKEYEEGKYIANVYLPTDVDDNIVWCLANEYEDDLAQKSFTVEKFMEFLKDYKFELKPYTLTITGNSISKYAFLMECDGKLANVIYNLHNSEDIDVNTESLILTEG